MLQEKGRGQLLIAPERMKRLCQSGNGSQLCMFSEESKVQCCKRQYHIGTWNVRFMNQGKLDMIKQEMARVKINILESVN